MTGLVAKADAKRLSPLSKLLEELQAYLGEKEGWKYVLVKGHEAAETTSRALFPEDGLEEGEERESTLEDVSMMGEDEQPYDRHSKDHPKATTAMPRYAFDHVEVVPPMDHFNGVVAFFHALPSDLDSPILVAISETGLTAEAGEAYLKGLALNNTFMLLADTADLDLAPGAVAFRWVQTLAGLNNDMAFAADPHRCLSAFFRVLQETPLSTEATACATMDVAEASQEPLPGTDHAVAS